MTLFLLNWSQNESSLTQNGVKKHKKVSKSEIMNQNTLKKQWNQNLKFWTKTCLKDSEMIQYLKLWHFFWFWAC